MAPSGGTVVRRTRTVVVPKPVEERATPVSRFARRRWRIVVASCALVLIAAGYFLAREAHSGRELASARSNALAAARVRLPVMMSYSYESIDSDLELASGNTTGKFREAYTRLLRDKVQPFATQNKVTNSVVVTDSSVASGDRHEVVVRMLITQTTKTADGGPAKRVSQRVRIKMSKTNQGWFVSQVVHS